MDMMKEIPAEIRNHLQRITLIVEQLEKKDKIPQTMASSAVKDLQKIEKILQELPPETLY